MYVPLSHFDQLADVLYDVGMLIYAGHVSASCVHSTVVQVILYSIDDYTCIRLVCELHSSMNWQWDSLVSLMVV